MARCETADGNGPLCAPAFLARLLGEAAGIPEWREAPPREDLARAFAGLGTSTRRRLLALIPESTLLEIFSIAKERDLAQFLQALFQVAHTLENNERLPAASALYSALASLSEASPLRDRARARLDAVLGRGEPGARAEFLLRRLAGQSTEPCGLFGMVLAGLGYSRARLAAATLLGSASANPLTRGLGARTLSGIAGLLLEAPAFVFGARAAQAVSAGRADPHYTDLSQELLGSYLSFGAMHLVGGLGRLALGAWGRGAYGEGLLRLAVPPLSLFGGLLLGRRFEEELGLRRAQPRATTFIDTLATLLQLGVAGRMVPAVTTPEALWRRSLLERAPSGRESRTYPGTDLGWRGRWEAFGASATAGISHPTLSRTRRREPWREHLTLMSNNSEGDGRGPREGATGGKIVSLAAYRERRKRREDPTPLRVTTDRPEAETLSRRLLEAADADLWVDSLRHAMLTWHPTQSVRQFNAEFLTIEARLARHPAYLSALLGHLAIRDRPAAKSLLVLLDLAPAESWLRGDGEVQTALRRRVSETLSEEEVHDAAHVLHSRFLDATASPVRGDSRVRNWGESLWRQRLLQVPAVFLPALRDVTLGDSQFLFLTHRLGLHSEVYPNEP
ncbi:hypothetical protein F9K50_03295 [bacterium]|nr:MAG: hypothetical protein F9K50_03295 [bacterium]